MVFVSFSRLAFNVLLLSGFLSRLAHARPTERDAKASALFGSPVETDGAVNFQSIYGPVVTLNFPDPTVIYLNGTSYAFATNNKGFGPFGLINVQVATSTDNQTWTVMEGLDALPRVADWQLPKGVWSPDVVQLDDGSFIMYYAGVPNWAPRHHCIGVATSKTVTGPYQPLQTPFICPQVHSVGGAIDPDGFLDSSTGKRYVAYKVDGNSIGHGGICKNTKAQIVPTPIMLQEVDRSDGITLIGDAKEILNRDEVDGPLIEAPALHITDENIYFLFYSSHCYTTRWYKTRYATATNIWGPYTKNQEPLLQTGDGPQLVGPGGADIIKGGNMIVFHGHLNLQNIQGDLYRGRKKNTSDEVKGSDVAEALKTRLVRGMYSAMATFSGRSVNLSGPIPGSR